MLEAAAGNILQQVFLKASKAAIKEYQNVIQATQQVQSIVVKLSVNVNLS
jgi:hypothetical protein